MNTEESQYTRVEYKRSFLVSSSSVWQDAVEPYAKTHEDKYIHGTRLRLRRQTDTDTGRQLLKLNKKSDSSSPYFRTISRILLSPGEYEILDAVAGDRLSKTRYYHHYRGRLFSIDVYDGELDGLILCKTETRSLEELMKVVPPDYARLEVTEEIFFTGGHLSRVTHTELITRLINSG